MSVVKASALESLIYYTEDYPPFNFRENGVIKGISVDLLREVTAMSGVEIPDSNIILLPWSRSYRSALIQNNSGLFSTTKTSHREELFQWVGPIDIAKVTVMARKGSNIVINSPIDMANYRIGVMRDDVGEQMLFSLGVPRESMQEASIISQLIEQLYKNRIDLMVYDERSASWLIGKAGYEPDSFETVYILEQSEIYYAFNKNVDKALVKELQKNLDKIKSSTDSNGINRYQAIVEKYQ
ncbi:substrate-binding periplasmic protein [Vibrio ziniensis]|uniref:ABC transporter substrate-binding protein n=1 Tax=Vibrio ziniensis TaxID=2711221 RepID=A0A6G7CM56_9VIBR|nr:transporter substrate-binding domain-containing protein [Vibrio ziniensis]QIH43189.1 ABC transporter substrate-binding protein [Vibrio ziniensis]